jgi:hypothetical protein
MTTNDRTGRFIGRQRAAEHQIDGRRRERRRRCVAAAAGVVGRVVVVARTHDERQSLYRRPCAHFLRACVFRYIRPS